MKTKKSHESCPGKLLGTEVKPIYRTSVYDGPYIQEARRETINIKLE